MGNQKSRICTELALQVNNSFLAGLYGQNNLIIAMRAIGSKPALSKVRQFFPRSYKNLLILNGSNSDSIYRANLIL